MSWVLRLSALLFIFPFNLYSQNDEVRLLYHTNWKNRHEKKPKDQKKWQEFELFARMYARYAIPEEKSLPLVFNVIDIANSNKVDEALILEQIDIINTAFKGEMPNNTSRNYDNILAGDTKLRFCLGDPNGNIDGINFKEKELPYNYEQFALISDKKEGLQGAKKDEYINVWITELTDDMGGFAVMPDQDSLEDGIYIDPDVFGARPNSQNYKEGKTIIHLLGQYLGLKPLWNLQDCFDDGIEDTPIHNAPNYKCFQFSHITTCAGNGEEMIGNFMDATPDECAFMFTKGQMARMHSNLTDNGYRKKLLDGIKVCMTNINENNSLENRAASSFELDFDLMPNPASTILNIKIKNPEVKSKVFIFLYDIKGKILRKSEIPEVLEKNINFSLNIDDLISGTYYLEIYNQKNKKTKNFIKI